MCEIFGQLSPSGSRQFSFKASQSSIVMHWREDGRSGKDAMLGQLRIERLSRLERNFRFLGRDSVSQLKKSRNLTDERFAGSSNETDSSLQAVKERSGGTVNPSALSKRLSNTELLTVSDSWTRNCEMHLALRFGTSINLRRLSCREDKPSRKNRSGRPSRSNNSREVRWPIDKDGELLQR